MELTDRVLARLYAGEVSGEILATELGVSRTAVWKCVNRLKEQGVVIGSAANRGYRLISDDALLGGVLAHHLRTDWQAVITESATSTNDVAKHLAGEGADRVAVIAPSQSAGRGRLDRAFVSPPGGLYMSAVLRPHIPATDSGLVTAYAAVCVARAIERLTDLQAEIKWVNDVFVSGRKVCGILTEGGVGMEGGTLDYAVVGIGVNVADVPLPEVATSLERESGKRVSRLALAAEILDGLAALREETISRAFLDEYRSRSCVIGRDVLIGGRTPAHAVGIDDDCALIVTHDGVTERLTAGEVSVTL